MPFYHNADERKSNWHARLSKRCSMTEQMNTWMSISIQRSFNHLEEEFIEAIVDLEAYGQWMPDACARVVSPVHRYEFFISIDVNQRFRRREEYSRPTFCAWQSSSSLSTQLSLPVIAPCKWHLKWNNQIYWLKMKNGQWICLILFYSFGYVSDQEIALYNMDRASW